MNIINHFLQTNLNHSANTNYSNIYKEGLEHTHIFDKINFDELDEISIARILYLKNLSAKSSVSFCVPQSIAYSEKALMYLSFNDIESAIQALNTRFACEVIGTEAVSRIESTITKTVLKTYNTNNVDLHCFEYDGYTYPNFKVEELDATELLYIYIKTIDIYLNEDNITLKKYKMSAHIERALFSINEHSPLLQRAFIMLDSIINNTTNKLEEIIKTDIIFENKTLDFPIIFKSEMLVQIGLAYKNKFFYDEAYKFLAPFPMYYEKIECLIALRKSQEASDEIKSYIARIGSAEDRESRMLLGDLYIKLGHIYDDPKYFEISASIFESAKPYQIQGLFYFKKREFELAAVSLKKGLMLTPSNEKIKFSYGCALIELDRIVEAVQIFKELKDCDSMNEQISKNLSFCYCKLDDIESSLSTLKSIALSDVGAMNQYFFLSLKNCKIDNIKWCLGRISTIEIIRGSVAYILENLILTSEDLKILINNNPYVDKVSFNQIFKFD